MNAGFDPELERALRGVERPSARPEFRAALKQRFVASDEAAPAPEPAPRRRFGLVLLGGALAAAAAIVLVFLLKRAPEPTWVVLDGSGTGSVRIDGRPFDGADRQGVADALLSAREIETSTTPLRVLLRDEMVLELGPRTRLSQVRLAAAGAWSLRADAGSLRVATGPRFGGRGLAVHTADLALDVTGTIFAVDVDDHGSCVCCLEGSVACKPDGSDAARPVESGRMCFAYRDRSAPSWGAGYEPHGRPLAALQAWARERWR